jgi:hypothetical protein
MSLTANLQVPKTIWFNQEPGPSDNPDMPPRRPQIVSAVAFLTNNGKTNEILTAATPCDIIDWQVELQRAVIEREPPQICTQNYQIRTLEGGETIHTSFQMILNSWLYKDNQNYDVKCLFWGQLATASFKARIAV